MMRPKILVTGSRGMLGRDVVEAFERDCQVICLPKEELDITDEARVGAVLSESRPSVVINCAAFTKVDLCEEKRELAFLVNAKGPENLARWCSKLNIKLVHISTDYVFDGTASAPYDEDSPTCPINVYGASKLEGEEAVARSSTDFLIIRTSWLFGRSGPNFITTMLSLARERSSLQVVDDQRGRPTYTRDLAWAIGLLLEKSARGIVNFANSGDCTWFDLCRYSLKRAGIDHVTVEPVSSDRFKRPARRPAYSVLSLERFRKLTHSQPRHWKEAVDSFLKEIGASAN